MKSKRALETIAETRKGKHQNSAHMAEMRALESPCETMFRLQEKRSNMAKKESIRKSE